MGRKVYAASRQASPDYRWFFTECAAIKSARSRHWPIATRSSR